MRTIRVALIRGSALNPFDAQQYERLGAGVEVVAFGATHARYEVDRIGLPVRRLPAYGARIPRPLQRRLDRIGWPGADALVGLSRAVRGFDVLHVAETFIPFSAQAALIRRRRPACRLVVTVWENIPFLHDEDPRTARRKALVRSAADGFIAVSEQARAALIEERVAEARIVVRPPAVSETGFSPDRRAEDALRSLSLPAGSRIVLYVGRLIREKGLLDLLRATAELGPEAHLVLVGAGPERARLELAAHQLRLSERVHFLDAVSYGEVGAVMAAADVFVLASLPTPYWQEQFGMVLAEAMHCGVPIVACDSGAIPEVVGDAALLAPPYDHRSLAAGIGRVLGEPELRARLIERGQARAAERYDVGAAGRWWAQYYRRIVESQSGG